MRPLADLLSPQPAFPLIQSWIVEATSSVEILPTDRARGERVLMALQVTTRSPMGALALETGGLLIDRGWLRVLGGGGARMDGDLARWNGLGERPLRAGNDGMLIVAYDVIGGFFALDGGALGEGKGGVFYFAPDSLEWEELELGYSDWLSAMMGDAIGDFYAGHRWDGWEKEVGAVLPDQGLSIWPPLSTVESRPIEKTSRRAVPIAELHAFHVGASGRPAE